MSNLTLTQKELLRVLNYNPETGIFIWLIFRRRAEGVKKYPMTIAGTVSRKPQGKSYLNIKYKTITYGCQRLAWFFTYTEFPPKGFLVDHIDGDTLNNKITNLRLLTPSENAKNIVLTNKDGLKYCKYHIKLIKR